jgi:tryptophanyl-tRNA synthetase
VQHIEVCRDLGRSFNHLFGEVFATPRAQVMERAAKVPGTDGEKMSKSYNNTIEIFEEPASVKKKIMRITTDSRAMEEPKDPDTDHLYQLYSLFVGDAERDEMAALYRRGGFGYGTIKKELVKVAEGYFAEARERRRELEANPDRVRQILSDGALRARRKASEVLRRAQRACGLG